MTGGTKYACATVPQANGVMAHVDLLSDVTFHSADLERLPYPEMRGALETRTVIRVRGLFEPGLVRAAVRTLAVRFDHRDDRKHDRRDTEAVRRNLQKLQVGGVGATPGGPPPRLVRIFYNPIFAADVLGMREHFIRLAGFRNRLYGLPPDFAVHGTEQELWTASRVHQYPRGGGFMAPHRDALTRLAVADACRFYQVLLVLTKKGEDFEEGGAFVESGDERVFYEGDCEVGDVIVYDGQAVHGVADIDPLEPLDLTSLSGRLVAFAALYRHLRPGHDDYDRLTREARVLYPGGEPGPPSPSGSSSTEPIGRAGLPATMIRSGTSSSTTAPKPTRA